MKKFKTILLLGIIVIFFTFNGCTIENTGNTLNGFTERMNQKNSTYSMTNAGYIFDEKENTLTKYYVINHTNIMLQFNIGESNKLYSMNIVFDNLAESNTQEIEFVRNCIECYCDNGEACSNLLSEVNFPQVLYTKKTDTTKAKIGNTEMLIDVTDIGCVISVVQNTL